MPVQLSTTRVRTPHRARRGMTLVEIMASVFVLGLTVMMASAFFPLSALMRDRSGYHSRAAAVLQRKLEQVRRIEAAQISEANLRSQSVIDSGGYTAGSVGIYYFTNAERLSNDFPRPIGYLILTGMGTDLVRADAYVTWVALNGDRLWEKTSTYIADKSVWREP